MFFFLAFVFAYFYLRSLNQHGMWKPAHVKPDQALGVAFAVCIVLSALSMVLAGRQFKRGERSWTTAAAAGLGLGLAAIVLQCIEYTVQNFGPTDGAFASVFCAWTAFYLLAALAHDVLARDEPCERAPRPPRTRLRRGRHQGPRPADRAGAGCFGLLLELPGGDRAPDTYVVLYLL